MNGERCGVMLHHQKTHNALPQTVFKHTIPQNPQNAFFVRNGKIVNAKRKRRERAIFPIICIFIANLNRQYIVFKQHHYHRFQEQESSRDIEEISFDISGVILRIVMHYGL